MNLSNYRLPYPHEVAKVADRQEWLLYHSEMERLAGRQVPTGLPVFHNHPKPYIRAYGYSWLVEWLVPTYKETFEMINKYYGL